MSTQEARVSKCASTISTTKQRFKFPPVSRTKIAADNPGSTAEELVELHKTNVIWRMKEQLSVDKVGTQAFNLVFLTLSPQSQDLVEADSRFASANNVEPKDLHMLYKIIEETHSSNKLNGCVTTEQQKEDIYKEFQLWTQGILSLDDFLRQFNFGVDRLKSIGYALTDPQIVTKFLDKLHPKYKELKARLQSDELIAISKGGAYATLTLTQAVLVIRGHEAMFATTTAAKSTAPGKPVGVFAVRADDPAATKDALRSLSRLTGTPMKALEEAIEKHQGNGKPGQGWANTRGEKGGGKDGRRAWACTILDKTTGKPCGSLDHRFFEHTAKGYGPTDPANQKKMDDYAAKRTQAKPKHAADPQVFAAKAHTGDSSDDEADAIYFVGVIEAVVTHNPFSDNNLLYDTQAGLSMVRNASLLDDVRPLPIPRKISGIGSGTLIAHHDGILRGYPGVRFCVVPNASAQILAEADTIAAGWKHEINDTGSGYIVKTPTGNLVFDLLPGWNAHPAATITDHPVLVTTPVAIPQGPVTVADNMSMFSKRQVDQAKQARKLQRNMGNPCAQVLKQALPSIIGTTVTAQDVTRAIAIASEPLETARGGTHHKTPRAIPTDDTPRPPLLTTTMEIDLFFICGLCFIVAVILEIDYVYAAYLKHKTVAEISGALLTILASAKAHNVDITIIRCDGEKAVAAYVPELQRMGIEVACQPHVKCPHVERKNQDIGTYVRGQLNGGFPARMGVALLVMCVLFKASRLNDLPTKNSPNGVSPRINLLGRNPHANAFDNSFGDYVEATVFSNGAKSDGRTEPHIVGHPTNSLVPSYHMQNLITGRVVVRHEFKTRPWNESIQAAVNALADEDSLRQGDQYITDDTWEFAEDAESQVPLEPASAESTSGAGVKGHGVSEDGATRLGVDTDRSGVDRGYTPTTPHKQQTGSGVDSTPPSSATFRPPPSPAQVQLPAPRRGRTGGTDSLGSLPPPPGNAVVQVGIDAALKEAADRSALRHEMDKRSHWHDREYCFKVSVRAALRDRGESARVAILDELRQMLTKKVWHGVHVKDLTPAQRARILRMVTFLKDKYTPQNIFDKFKCRTCVDGSGQDHDLYENLSSPTATSTSVLGVAAIAAAEGRHVMTIDIGGAFLHADIASTGVTVHVRLDKIMTQFLLELDPSYQEFVCQDGTCVVKLDKALYGTIEAAKLWYDNLSEKLIQDGFVPNPYDPCVFNRTTKHGEQITIVLYVDDMLVTCVDVRELDKVAAHLRKCYIEIAEHRGKVIDFLGMTFDFTTKGKVRVTMKRLVDEIIAGCGVTTERATPARENLFEIRDAPKLGRKDHDYFRSYVAKLLYVAKRVKPEMLTAVSFLTTRATAPDSDDLAKLQRALGYLLGTRERGIVLCIGGTLTVQAFVDAAYGVHTSSGKSHSGCAVILGAGGPIHVKSTKQKLVTKSSTEAELVALSDYASQAIWVRNFIIAQGYDVGPVVLHQDNMSCMALVKRGGPASERTRHISIRQFWVKEKVDGKEAVVKYLPTGKMFVNVMTKPLQGQQFILERNALTNWD